MLITNIISTGFRATAITAHVGSSYLVVCPGLFHTPIHDIGNENQQKVSKYIRFDYGAD